MKIYNVCCYIGSSTIPVAFAVLATSVAEAFERCRDCGYIPFSYF